MTPSHQVISQGPTRPSTVALAQALTDNGFPSFPGPPVTPSDAADSTAIAPLTPEDYDRLDDALDRMREQDDEIPSWEFCEGFLAALICMRREPTPEEYWPVLLGEDFRPMAHMEFVFGWRRRWREIALALDAPVQDLSDERSYQPEALDARGAILALPPEERTPGDDQNLPAYAQVWALGFMYAVESWPEEWAPPRDPEAAGMLDAALQDIVTLTEDQRGTPTVSMFAEDGPPSVSDERLDDFAAAIWAVYALRQLFRSLGPRIDPIRKAPAPGRNDPCPCGSGKKYKKCHGAG